jgi:hypothetical protein
MNAYYWHAWFSCRKWRWYERRLRGAVAPNGDLADGHWEYRLPQRSAL